MATKLLSIKPKTGPKGLHTFVLALQDDANAAAAVELAAAELQDYAATQRVVLERSGFLYRHPLADAQPPVMASWLWREHVAYLLSDAAPTWSQSQN